MTKCSLATVATRVCLTIDPHQAPCQKGFADRARRVTTAGSPTGQAAWEVCAGGVVSNWAGVDRSAGGWDTGRADRRPAVLHLRALRSGKLPDGPPCSRPPSIGVELRALPRYPAATDRYRDGRTCRVCRPTLYVRVVNAHTVSTVSKDPALLELNRYHASNLSDMIRQRYIKVAYVLKRIRWLKQNINYKELSTM